MPICKADGPVDARIMVVGEAPGEREEVEGKPFVGASGWELSKMLQEAGIQRTKCFLTNVCRVRPPSNDITKFIAKTKKEVTEQHVSFNGKKVLPFIQEGYEELLGEIERVDPNVIIAVGNTAMWALCSTEGISKWRGSCLSFTHPRTGRVYKVIPTYHPAAVLRQWKLRPIVVRDLRRAAAESSSKEYDLPEYNIIVRPTFLEVQTILNSLLSISGEKLQKIACDIETRAGHMSCIGIAWSRTDALCIPLMCEEKRSGYWTEEEETHIWFLLYKLLTHSNTEVVGQNFIYDCQYIHRYVCFIPRLKRDTMTAQHVCFNDMDKGLDFLASMYCQHYVYWKDEGKEWLKNVPEDVGWRYNGKDCIVTYEVDDVEQANIRAMRLEGPNEFQQSLFYPVLETMNKGIRLDADRQEALRNAYSARMEEKQEYLTRVLGYPINIRSPKQLSDLFYRQLQQRPVLNRKTGGTTCNEEALIKIASREPLLKPIVQAINEYRSDATIMSTFIDSRLDSDGRLRCSYQVSGTKTYRFTSRENAFGSGFNFQNVPPIVREMFVPDAGREFFDLDLSSADLRIVAWEADEREMKALLAAGLNPYVEVAKEYYHDQSITKQHEKYRIFKSFAHGTHYLGTPEGMAGKLGMTVIDCERLQKWYFGRFPRIKMWQDQFKGKVLSRHMVENVFGYRYYIMDRIDGNVMNEAIAWLPQSTIAILINKIWMHLYQNHRDLIEILLQVHDSLAGQYPIELKEQAHQAIHQASQIVLPYPEPLIIPIGIKTSQKSWGDCK